jgi:hypothetical protein
LSRKSATWRDGKFAEQKMPLPKRHFLFRRITRQPQEKPTTSTSTEASPNKPAQNNQRVGRIARKNIHDVIICS